MSDQPSSTGYSFEQLSFRCVTSLHIGVGQDVGVVDLPVARETTTGYPVVPGSGIRGAIRSEAESREGVEVSRIFGPLEGELTAGCVSFTDARLLVFPVRASHGVYLWVTCPFALERYREDRRYFLGGTAAAPPDFPATPLGDEDFWGSENVPPSLYLDEFQFRKAGDWEWQPPNEVPASRLVVINDAAFGYYARHATVVVQRNRLSTAKTVVDGGLFAIEAVPPEAVFYGFVGGHAERSDREGALTAKDTLSEVRKALSAPPGAPEDGPQVLVLGGAESIGFGLVRLEWGGGH